MFLVIISIRKRIGGDSVLQKYFNITYTIWIWKPFIQEVSQNTTKLGYACISPRKEKNSKPPTGENIVPRERKIKVNPNGIKQWGIPKKESPGIGNPKGDLNGRQTELVPRRPRENSNKDPSRSNSEAPAKAKSNPWKGIYFEFHAQVPSERARKGNKFLGAWRKIST